ncbi:MULTISPECIES: Holliday junction branch migration DNA helicase RuvB [Fusobacterium]|uniref:Holliday junction branch migration DNA helicase RuvB n=1 Tax=Fusobacterium TaxID=848 RepID=UPI001F4F7830|nr:MULTISPECIES: Holliday junction branch migration DNA helicase RuvB [Fusobacterium]MDD7410742.1 Holliday junction branch migration DNA helicase RuvB [Fusobacteriaceae bacterium]MCI5724755.1 Holliday junction branch migration DNA helicase RuvB [Fusobacterium sp.]MCI7224014.1 Holliday junction branch migration DNA helicase RuvB [Fusobacterium sp.]MDY5305232.1 Holliday junction branch migration DNA helicase RuvB [Fusobacterium gastrosuis]MDY5713095.1 Holliday junction branch migration DNA helic
MERIISDLEMANEVEIQKSLRPKTFREYIGQTNLKEKMSIYIEAAKKRNTTVDHILLYGPPGLGKTTLAGVIANEMKANLKITSGPILDKAGDLAAILTSLEENDILFIDEIHRLNSSVEEILYPAMEDGELDIMIGKGPSARSIRIELPPFTLVGATTRAGLLSSPLRDRFGVSHKMEYYNNDEIKGIIIRGAKILGVGITEEGAEEISKRSRGTPRIANRLLKRVRDYCDIKGNGNIDKNIANKALDMLGVDENGLDDLDRNIVNSIIENYDGGPVGIETLSLLLGEDKRTLEEVYEPYLVKIGFLKRTNRGRVVTPKAYQHFRKVVK